MEKAQSYVPHHGLEPEILAPKWLSPVNKFEADLIKDDNNELMTMLAHVSRAGLTYPGSANLGY